MIVRHLFKSFCRYLETPALPENVININLIIVIIVEIFCPGFPSSFKTKISLDYNTTFSTIKVYSHIQTISHIKKIIIIVKKKPNPSNLSKAYIYEFLKIPILYPNIIYINTTPLPPVSILIVHKMPWIYYEGREKTIIFIVESTWWMMKQ